MTAEPYFVVAGYGAGDFTERRSRFISQVWPVTSEQQALLLLAETRSQYKDATHNVFGYRLKTSNIMRVSDDGEPSQTAGLPLMEAFMHRDIYDFFVVSTRYFGGTLLGTGGLIRAYAQSGRLALENAGIAQMRLWNDCRLECPYPLFEQARRLLASMEAVETDAVFQHLVELHFSIASEKWDELCLKITELSSGTLSPILVECKFKPLLFISKK